MPRSSWLLLLCVAACGRIGFEETRAGDGGSGAADAASGLCADVLLCSGFEKQGLPAWQQQIVLGGATLSTTTDRSFRGQRSLKVEVFQSGDEAVVAKQLPQSFASGELWVRGWVFIPGAYNANSFAGLVYLSESAAPRQYLDATLTSDTACVFREKSATGSDIDECATVALADQWRCFEWKVLLGTEGEMALFVDSQLVAETGTRNMEVQGGGYSYVNLGQADPIDSKPGAPIYIDDVIISRERVGCGRQDF